MWKALIQLVWSWSCKHDWEKLNDTHVWDRDHHDNKYPAYTVKTWRCKHCCQFRKVKIP